MPEVAGSKDRGNGVTSVDRPHLALVERFDVPWMMHANPSTQV